MRRNEREEEEAEEDEEDEPPHPSPPSSRRRPPLTPHTLCSNFSGSLDEVGEDGIGE